MLLYATEWFAHVLQLFGNGGNTGVNDLLLI
jgi:hypothetical protein